MRSALSLPLLAFFASASDLVQPLCYGTKKVIITQTEWLLPDGHTWTAAPKSYSPDGHNTVTEGSQAQGHGKNWGHDAKPSVYTQNGILVNTWEQFDPNADGWYHGTKLWDCPVTSGRYSTKASSAFGGGYHWDAKATASAAGGHSGDEGSISPSKQSSEYSIALTTRSHASQTLRRDGQGDEVRPSLRSPLFSTLSWSNSTTSRSTGVVNPSSSSKSQNLLSPVLILTSKSATSSDSRTSTSSVSTSRSSGPSSSASSRSASSVDQSSSSSAFSVSSTSNSVIPSSSSALSSATSASSDSAVTVSVAFPARSSPSESTTSSLSSSTASSISSSSGFDLVSSSSSSLSSAANSISSASSVSDSLSSSSSSLSASSSANSSSIVSPSSLISSVEASSSSISASASSSVNGISSSMATSTASSDSSTLSSAEPSISSSATISSSEASGVASSTSSVALPPAAVTLCPVGIRYHVQDMTTLKYFSATAKTPAGYRIFATATTPPVLTYSFQLENGICRFVYNDAYPLANLIAALPASPGQLQVYADDGANIGAFQYRRFECHAVQPLVGALYLNCGLPDIQTFKYMKSVGSGNSITPFVTEVQPATRDSPYNLIPAS